MLYLYVNAEPQAKAAYTAPLKANGPLVVGRSQFDSHPSNFWPGAIEEVAVYQTVLTAEQVAEIYRTTKPSSPPPAQPAPDPSTYGNSILNGTWDYVVSDEDAQQFFLSDYGVTADEVRVRLGFNNNQWYEVAVFDGEPFFVNGVPEGDLGTFRIEGDRHPDWRPGASSSHLYMGSRWRPTHPDRCQGVRRDSDRVELSRRQIPDGSNHDYGYRTHLHQERRRWELLRSEAWD
jgi:hypothetical protein